MQYHMSHVHVLKCLIVGAVLGRMFVFLACLSIFLLHTNARKNNYQTAQQGMDIDEQAEAMLDEQLEHWQLVRDRINAGLPLPETGPAPEAAHQAEDEWGLQEAVQEEVDEEAPVVICTRCYALRHYGYVRLLLWGVLWLLLLGVVVDVMVTDMMPCLTIHVSLNPCQSQSMALPGSCVQSWLKAISQSFTWAQKWAVK